MRVNDLWKYALVALIFTGVGFATAASPRIFGSVLQLASATDANLPSPSAVGAGAAMFSLDAGTIVVSNGSAWIRTVKAPTVPSVPQNVGADGGSTLARVYFAEPADIGNVPRIVSYTATSSPGNISATNDGGLTVLVTGLSNGVGYTFTVKATNAVGDSAASAASGTVTPN